MSVFTRILLFILCISTHAALAAEPIAEMIEISDKSYTKIELTQEPRESVSILRTAQKIVGLVQEKSYSLLNWNTYSRSRPIEVVKYDRKEHFGRWISDPSNETCYNTRALVLIRDSSRQVTFSDDDKCSVESGFWRDDYTGKAFTKREEIQIDHFVPLKNAYVSGAHRWSFKARCLYANFMGNRFHLKAVNATQNMKKSDRGPEGYMPPNKNYACDYLKTWLTIKFLWGLTMNDDEKNSIYQMVRANRCRLSDFTISAREILKQNRYTQDNIDICESIRN